MVNFDATTPQSKAAKGLFDALAALDLNKARPVLSKDYLFKSFPKSAELPDLTKEEYIQKYNAILVLLAQVEVRAKRLGIVFELLADIHDPQFVFYEVIEAPGKVVTHVCPSLHRHLVQIKIHNYFTVHHLVHDLRWHSYRLRFSPHHLFRR